MTRIEAWIVETAGGSTLRRSIEGYSDWCPHRGFDMKVGVSLEGTLQWLRQNVYNTRDHRS